MPLLPLLKCLNELLELVQDVTVDRYHFLELHHSGCNRGATESGHNQLDFHGRNHLILRLVEWDEERSEPT